MKIPFLSPRRPGKREVDEILSQPILWFLVVIFIAASCSILGFSIALIYRPNNESGFTNDPDFFSVLGNVFLTCLSVYCTLVPVLRDQVQGRREIKVRVALFYASVAVVLIASILTPILYARLASQQAKVASSILGVISGTFQATVSAQLAGGITQGLLELRRRRVGV
jgi:magnesium-transporting ATPase (P-type)